MERSSGWINPLPMRAARSPGRIMPLIRCWQWSGVAQSPPRCDKQARISEGTLSSLGLIRCGPLTGRDRSKRALFGATLPTGWRIEKAREIVWQTISAVGGLSSPGGSCLSHVVGWERSLKEWALDQGWNGRPVLGPKSASGILIAALGTLDAHYRHGTVLRKSKPDLDKSGSI